MPDPAFAQLREEVHRLSGQVARPLRVMEVCGTHTMAVARSGLRSLLPEGLELISGPGCPVCVTDAGFVDAAVELGRRGATIATYGDMIRVPGSRTNLSAARAEGANVEVVASADRAVDLAAGDSKREVVFLGIGFETTAPGTALAVRRAAAEGRENFSVLGAHKVMPPAMHHLLASGELGIDAFLCPGHVSVIIGWRAFAPLVERFERPCVVAGFDPGQILHGLAAILRQLAEGRPRVENVYPTVSAEGNAHARELIDEVFAPADAVWRGLGTVPGSALELREAYAAFDARRRHDVEIAPAPEPPGCRCGDVILGRCRPPECALFGARCTPRDPVGPCMVSAEGACAAAYKYDRAEVGRE